jgi:hypothetical protein
MRELKSLSKVAAVAAVLLVAGQARAVEVFFNGVQVTGLKSQSFEGCRVKFDADGNVHITAKGYKVKRLDQSAVDTSKDGLNLPKRYFIYSKASREGYAQYDVDVYLNGKWIRKVRNTESQVVADITSKLRPGKNVVHFAATKSYGGKPRLSSSASDYIQVFIGEGNRGGGTVNITTTLASFKATASTTANFGQEQTITIK